MGSRIMDSIKFKELLLSVLILLSATGSASSDWQYTKWGMSPQQVVAASSGKAKPYPGGHKIGTSPNGQPVYETHFAAYRSGPFGFRASFAFAENKGLIVVALTADSPSDCGDIKNSLLSKYGRPALDNESIGLTKWFDQPNNNIISIITLGAFCSIQYQPFSRGGGADGL